MTLTDVKAEDANGIKAEGALPDLTELQTQLENKAREELIAKVHEKVVELPHKIYDVARQKEQDGYADDAGEAYMRYLNVAPADQIERARPRRRSSCAISSISRCFRGRFSEPARRPPPLEQGMAQPAK